uniref:P-loop NTPase fold protein n=1 Tax=Klebsiella pneumoniae TaxID=573 RepID=UPI003D2FA248
MTLRLQTESPADQDMFRGSSHEKVAENVAQIIRTPDVNIIGLEGELGSGKSTILKFLQKSLKMILRSLTLMQNVTIMAQLKSAYRCHPPRGQPTMSGLPGCVG